MIINFMKNPKNFLIYCGTPGIGKTYVCSALVEWAMTTFRSFRYWNERDLLKKVRASMDEFKGDYLDALNYLIDDELVILDDMGSQEPNSWRKEIFFDAVDARYNSMKPTIITSNFSIEQFRKIYHPRLCSRLFAKENTIIEIMDGVDQRAI